MPARLQTGLRTLLVAKKTLTEIEYAKFREAYAEAETALNDREEKVRWFPLPGSP